MGPDRDRTRDPWICSQIRICSQTRYRYASVARHVTDCATRPGKAYSVNVYSYFPLFIYFPSFGFWALSIWVLQLVCQSPCAKDISKFAFPQQISFAWFKHPRKLFQMSEIRVSSQNKKRCKKNTIVPGLNAMSKTQSEFQCKRTFMSHDDDAFAH